jgi:hypothetical protein
MSVHSYSSSNRFTTSSAQRRQAAPAVYEDAQAAELLAVERREREAEERVAVAAQVQRLAAAELAVAQAAEEAAVAAAAAQAAAAKAAALCVGAAGGVDGE